MGFQGVWGQLISYVFIVILSSLAVKSPQLKDMVFRPIKEEEEEEVDLDQYLDQLDGDIRDLCEKLQEQK